MSTRLILRSFRGVSNPSLPLSHVRVSNGLRYTYVVDACGTRK
jgi:hypothetical protein